MYRYQAVSVGWWRGKIKRWNTTFYRSNSTGTSLLYDSLQKIGYPNPGDVEGDCSGGVASIAVYSSTGGVPISNTIYFDWQTPSEWIPFDGDAWASLDPQPPLDASGESAAVVIGHLPGLSASGKPVSTRKYFHAIPSRTAADYADPDIDSTCQAAILTALDTTFMISPSGVSPSTVECEPYYLNHQRVRGRRRSPAAAQSQAFADGVVVGAGAAAGGGQPFRSQ